MKKRIALLGAALLFLCLFTFVSCTPDLSYATPKVVSVTVDGITVVEYTAGDALSVDGATLHVVYDNGEIKVLDLDNSMIDEDSYNMAKPGAQTVVVSYGGQSTSFDILVNEWRLTTVELISEPYVTTYVEGEKINLEGAVLRMNFEKGLDSSVEKHSDFALTDDMLSDYDNYQLGEQTVYVVYNGATLSFNVTFEEKTATSVKIVDSAENNFVYVEKGQYTYVVYDVKTGKPLSSAGATVDGTDFAEYDSLSEANEAIALFIKNFGGNYRAKIYNHYDLTGMTVRIGYDNNQTPLYYASTGESLETAYKAETELPSCLYVSIEDDIEKTVEATLLYLPADYPETFRYTYYGKAYVKVGSTVQPDTELASNHIVRDGKEITLDAVTSKSYGKVLSVNEKSDGTGEIVVSTYMNYSLTNVLVKEGDIICDNQILGSFGESTVFSIGGGLVDEVRDDGTLIIRTAPTTTFVGKVQSKSYQSMNIVDTDAVKPTRYPDTTTIKAMIQGDTVDLKTGEVRVQYDDGSAQTFSFASSMIAVVNANAETVNQPLDVSEPGWYELWIVYGGVLEHHVSLYVGVESKYPTNLYIVTETDSISGKRFYVGDTISISSMQYYIRYNNETESERRQLTEDMLAEGSTLYCEKGSDGGAYVKTIRFKLPEEDAESLPEDGEEIFAESISCRVIPQTVAGTDLEVLQSARKVYVTSYEKIDFTGAAYSVAYRNSTTVHLSGEEITEAINNGTGELTQGGKIQKSQVEDNDGNLYVTEDCKLYVYSTEDVAADSSLIEGKTKIGRRCIARLTYFDSCYSKWEEDTASDTPTYFEAADNYSCSADFYYYIIDNDDWKVTSLKVNLDAPNGINYYKDTYVQYEDWDLAGVYVTLSFGSTTRKVNATADMIYDSDTNTVTEGDDTVAVKFYFLGASDDDTLKITVVPRKEDSITLITEGKTAYLSTQALDFSDYTFYMYYNAGPFRPVRSLRNVSGVKQKDGWWYALYQKLYVVYNADGEAVDKDGNPVDASNDEARLATESLANERVEALLSLYPTAKYTVGWVKGSALSSSLMNVSGKTLVELHHTVSESDTDISVLFEINVTSASYEVEAVRYIGTDTAISADVAGTHSAGYGSGSQYAVWDKYGRVLIVSQKNSAYNLVGYLKEDGSIYEYDGYTVYYATEAKAKVALEELCQTLSLSNTQTAYEVKQDWVSGKYILINHYGSTVLTDGSVLRYYYNTKDDADAVSDVLNGIILDTDGKYYVFRNNAYLNEYGLKINADLESGIPKTKKSFATAEEARVFLNSYFVYQSPSDNLYYVMRNGNAVNENGDEITENTSLKRQISFLTADEANAYVATLSEKTSSAYTAGNYVYVLGEVAAGWDIMMTEYIDDVLVEKKLTVYYADGTESNVAITAEMLSYDKMDSSTGYRRVDITYKNFSCYVYIYVWRATLTGVSINETHQPLKNYIRNAELDVSDGVLNLTFTKFNKKGVSVGKMMKYIAMTDSDITYTGFRSDIYTKSGVQVTVNVLYRDYTELATSYVITVYDLQDIPFTFNNTIFFYGNVSAASFGMDSSQQIPEFTFPSKSKITMEYVQSKDLIPYKQFEQMELSEDQKKGYYSVKGYDENQNLVTLYYISSANLGVKYINDKNVEVKEEHPFDPASGTYYAIYSAYVLKDADGEVLERYTASEYKTEPDSAEEFARYSAEEYVSLPAFLRTLCTEVHFYTFGTTVKTQAEYDELSADNKAQFTQVTEYSLSNFSLRSKYSGESLWYIYSEEEYEALDTKWQNICTHISYVRIEGDAWTALYTAEEYNALPSDERTNVESLEFYVVYKHQCTPVTFGGDILYSYSAEQYALLSTDQKSLCQEVNNVYYLFMSVNDPNNKYYENSNYCLQEYSIIPKVVDISVTPTSTKAFVLRVTTGNNAAAIAYLHNTENLKNATDDLLDEDTITYIVNGKTYKEIINDISLISPNRDYFELKVEIFGSDMSESGDGFIAAKECFYYLLKTMYTGAGVSGIMVGDEKKLISFTDSKTEAERKEILASQIEVGVNCFTELKSDTDYHISYTVTYGELLKRHGVLDLLSGSMQLQYNEEKDNFTVLTGTLSHGSYTLDLATFTLTLSGQKTVQVGTMDQSEQGKVMRIYLPNANEVYSKWMRNGDFENLRKELAVVYPDVLSENGDELSMASPNREYFDIVYVPGSRWTDSDDEQTAVRDIFYTVFGYMKSYGATEGYFGENIHLFTEDTTDSQMYVDFDADSDFVQEVRFTGKNTDLSSAMLAFYNRAATEDADVAGNFTLSAEETEYILQVSVIDNWRGTNNQKSALGRAIYLFLSDFYAKMGEDVFFNGNSIEDCTESTFINWVKAQDDITDHMLVQVPFSIESESDKIYRYICGYMEANATVICENCEGVKSFEICLPKAVSYLKLTYRATGSLTYEHKEHIDNLIYAWLSDLTARYADRIYYGTGVSKLDVSVSTETAFNEVYARAVHTGVNIFQQNRQNVYDIVYTMDKNELLLYNNVYMLLEGAPTVESSGTGEKATTLGTLDNHYYLVQTQGEGTVRITE